ncbi:MAG: NAD+ kinase [Verrucomicrobiales bacterium]|jgi:NAD+ kinase
MARIGVVLHGADSDALEHAEELASILTEQGHQVVALVEDAQRVTDMSCVEPADFARGLDLAVSLGGDGTILRTVALLDGADVKILGVNFGDLGYLTVVDRDELEHAVQRSLAGDHDIEKRMLVSGEVSGQTMHALNDIVVERSPGDTTVRIGVTIDGARFTSYPADGLIVSTPTGSTAYALSARGPIVFPTHYALQITPVSPHMLFDRSLVLGPDSEIELTIEGHRSAVVSADGNTLMTMEPGETILCRRSPHTARLVIFDTRDNLAVLKSKLGIADR